MPRMHHKKQNAKKRRQGTSLVEAVVATFLLAIGITGVSKVILSTKKLSSMASEKSTEIQLVKNRMEQMSTGKFDDLSAWSTSDLVTDKTGSPDNNGLYKISTSISYHPVDTVTNLAEVVIQLNRRNRRTLAFDIKPQQFTAFFCREIIDAD